MRFAIVVIFETAHALLFGGGVLGLSQRVNASPPHKATVESTIGSSNAELLDDEEREIAEQLMLLGQSQLFEDWPEAGVEDDGKKELMQALLKCDQSYVGGLKAYVEKAKALLASSDDSAFEEGLSVSVPEGETLMWNTKEFYEAEEAGLASVKEEGLGFVLVAGGLGERLGYSGIKLELPVESATSTSFIQLYCEYIAALSKKAGRVLPLAIMTSDDTDAKTRELLRESDNFGLEDVTIIKQDKVPALSDSSASLAKEDWKLLTKPHGHGDVHALMQSSGTAARWKVGHVFFFQDTNALALNTLLPALGVSVKRSFSMNSVCIPRRAKEAAGGIAKLGDDLVINVEYNQLDPLLKANGKSDVNDESGFSPFPGNANVLLMKADDYVATISGKDQGVVDEFVNPKYNKDGSFKKPTRLECMMQDFPKLLVREVPKAKVGFTSFERWVAFSPAKNDLSTARSAAKSGEPAGSAGSCEFDFYHYHFRRTVENDKASTKTQTLGGVVDIYDGPKIVFKPSFAITQKDVDEKVSSLTVEDDGLLVVDGDNVQIKSLTVKKGALFLQNLRHDATLVVDGYELDQDHNDFFHDIPDDHIPEAKPSDQIRGFVANFEDAVKITLDKPGTYVLGKDKQLKGPIDAKEEL